MLLIKPKYKVKKGKLIITVTSKPSLEPEQKRIKLDHLINGKGIVYN